MMVGSKLAAAVLLGALAPQVGCSFLFVDKPTASAGYASGSDCTSSPVAPIIDMVVSVWQLARVGGAAGASDADFQGATLSRGAVMVSGTLLFLLFGASTISGFSNTAACREMQDGPAPQVTRAQPPRVTPRPPAAPAPAVSTADAGAPDGAPTVEAIPAAPPDAGRPPPATQQWDVEKPRSRSSPLQQSDIPKLPGGSSPRR